MLTAKCWSLCNGLHSPSEAVSITTESRHWKHTVKCQCENCFNAAISWKPRQFPLTDQGRHARFHTSSVNGFVVCFTNVIVLAEMWWRRVKWLVAPAYYLLSLNYISFLINLLCVVVLVVWARAISFGAATRATKTIAGGANTALWCHLNLRDNHQHEQRTYYLFRTGKRSLTV